VASAIDRGELRRRLVDALDAVRVLPPLARLRERWIAARAPDSPAVGPDAVSIPPPRLRVLVDGHGDPGGFLADAEAGATMIRRTLARAGVEPADLSSILDFGCGCGRIARHWAKLSRPALHGCDSNPELVEWCHANLPFMEVTVSGARPPSPYEDDRFDLVYAVSVLTHLTEPAAEAWLVDFARILRPGGLLLLTTHGDSYRERLTSAQRTRYARGQAVVQRARMQGTNACAAYHPPAYVRNRLLHGFEIISSPGAAPDGDFPQDVYLARLPA
jgi:SAM-dependent methyltransferase